MSHGTHIAITKDAIARGDCGSDASMNSTLKLDELKFETQVSYD